jgi:Branched-chain amino acid ATP-binding cassette transporter
MEKPSQKMNLRMQGKFLADTPREIVANKAVQTVYLGQAA